MLKVATWNVNSINARLPRVLDWISRASPDVLCLQELKCADGDFPEADLRGLGYHCVAHGQKTYNGVAILSRSPLEHVRRGFSDGGDDTASRFLSARIGDITVMSAYIPNGQAVGSEKYAYKLEWLRRLRAYLDRAHRPNEPLLLAGDFNVAPEDRDVHDPDAWRGQILFSEPEKDALRQVTAFGLADTFRKHHAEGGKYSWWDYRMLAFPKNRGLRIDFILATQPLYERCHSASIERDERKGERPSDHVPVMAVFDV